MARRRPLGSNRGAELRDHSKRPLSPQDGDCVRDWTKLAKGEDVLIFAEDGLELSGRVDAVTRKGEILWLHLSSGAGRKLFIRSEGAEVWRNPSDDGDSATTR